MQKGMLACADVRPLSVSIRFTEVMRNLLRAHSALHRAPAMASPASGRRSLRARQGGKTRQDYSLSDVENFGDFAGLWGSLLAGQLKFELKFLPPAVAQ